MRLTAEVKRRLPELLPLLLDMPDEQFFDLSDHQLQFQCATQAEVQEVRRRFPGTIWKKSFTPGPGVDWWEYHASWKGLDIHIYACREAPPTCQRIEEEVEVEVSVPVEFETHLVRKTVVRWDCGPDEVQP